MTGVEEIASKYASELAELRCNSKPLINSLTMMAEDYIRHAPVIVQTIENHLSRVKAELKLPVLYLIDSIVKNVKKEYINLFTQNIVATFANTFEQVPDKTRTQMWKLRQTWNDVFSTKKLYQIDFKCHQMDPGWPITAAAPSSTPSIHVNPKFLARRAITISSATATTPSIVTSTVSSPSTLSLTGTGLGELGISSSIVSLPAFTMDPPGDITEAQMREQLLMKQKELLELQTKKLELELLHTKAQLEERTRKQQIEQPSQQQPIAAVTKTQQLLQQAEMAKHQTDIATSLLMNSTSGSNNTNAGSVSPTTTTSINTLSTPIPLASDSGITTTTISSSSSSAGYLADPRKRRGKDSSSSRSVGNYHNLNHRDEEAGSTSKVKIKSEPLSKRIPSPPSPSSFVSTLNSRPNPTASPIEHKPVLSVPYPTSPISLSSVLPLPSAILSSDPRRRSKQRSPEFKPDVIVKSPRKEKDWDQPQAKDKTSTSDKSHSSPSSRSRSSPSSSSASGRKLEVPSSSSPPKAVSPIRDTKMDTTYRASSPLPTVVSSSDPRKRKHRENHRESNSSKVIENTSNSNNKRGRDDIAPVSKDSISSKSSRSDSRGRTSTASPTNSGNGNVLASSGSNNELSNSGSVSDESPSKRRKKSESISSKDPRSKRSHSREKEKDVKVKESSKEKDSKRSSIKVKSGATTTGASTTSSSSSSSAYSSSSSRTRRRQDSEANSSGKGGSNKDIKESPSSKESKESSSSRGDRKRIRDELKMRKFNVLGKNYRRRPDASNASDDENEDIPFGLASSLSGGMKKDKKSDSSETLRSGNKNNNSKTMTNDVDLRFEGLKDVDLRSETTTGIPGGPTPSSVDSQQPPLKKSRTGNANLIDDLFGREDVDLRQQSTSSNWSQVKRTPSTGLEAGSDNESFGGEDRDRRSDQKHRHDEDIRDILNNRPHPPPAISPAGSVDSIRTVTCDPLGRPLLYNRLPDDPSERKRSLDSRSATIDPVERFRSQYIERPSGGDLTDLDLEKAARQAQQEFEVGFFTRDQYAAIMRQLMQIYEVNKIRDVQQRQQMNRVGPNPWTGEAETNAWTQFGPRGPADFGGANRFPGANTWTQPQSMSVWGPQLPQPRGPNPFEEAAAAAIGPQKLNDDLLPLVNMMELETVRKDTSGTIPIDKVLRQVRFYGDQAVVLQGMLGDEPRDISFRKTDAKSVFIDQEREPLRCFIGKPVLIYLDRKKHMLQLGTAPTRELYIDGDHYEACYGGPPARVRVDRFVHFVKINGPPPQVEVGKVLRHDLLAGRVNLFVDGNSVTIYLDEKPQLLDLCGFPVILQFCNGFHTVLLNGRPFQTNFGELPMSVTVPGGRKHYLRFAGLSDLTKRAMANFIRIRQQKGGPGMRDDDGLGMADIPPFGVPPQFHGRGAIRGRGGMVGIRGARPPMFNNPMIGGPMDPMFRLPGSDMAHVNDAFHPNSLAGFDQTNPLDVLANIMPSQDQDHDPFAPNIPGDLRGNRRLTLENSYESDTSQIEEKGSNISGHDNNGIVLDSIKTESQGGDTLANALVASSPLDVQDLLSKLMMAGLLPASADGDNKDKDSAVPSVKEEEEKDKPSNDASNVEVTVKEKPTVAEVKKEGRRGNARKKKEPVVIPPLETVDVEFDKLKERRDKLIATVTTGVQCGSCGLRFPPDQTVRYSQHLDWHFRQNRREKANVKKALSRRWYYDLSDWIQFAEIEDLEERAQSLFESQDADLDGEQRSPGSILNPDGFLNPDLYTVLSADHEGAVCPQCNEGFESFFDEDKEEWRLRDAYLAESGEDDGAMKLYHPICHQDYMACVQGKSILTTAIPPEEEVMETVAAITTDDIKPEEEEEVLIIKEGKPEVEVMELVEDETEEETSLTEENKSKPLSSANTEIDLLDESVTIVEKDSEKQNETICVTDDNDDNNDENIDNAKNNNDDNIVDVNNKIETETKSELSPKTQTTDSSSISHTASKNVSINNNSDVITLSGDTMSTNNNNNNSSSSSNNISVNVLPTLVQIDDDTNDGALFRTFLPGISNLDDEAFNSAALTSSPSNNKGNSKSDRAPYRPMKFDNPTPIIKTEPVDPDEVNMDHLSLDQIIKANMTDEAQDGMELGEGPVISPLMVNLGTPPVIPAVDIDLTAEDDEDSSVVNPAALSTLDGNYLLSESIAPKPILSQPSKLKSGFRIHIQDAILSTDSMDSTGTKSPLPSGTDAGEDGVQSAVKSPNPQSQDDKNSEPEVTSNVTLKESEAKSGSVHENSTDTPSATTSSNVNIIVVNNNNKHIVTSTITTESIVNNNNNTVQQGDGTSESLPSDTNVISNNPSSNVIEEQGTVTETESEICEPDLSKLKPRLVGRKFINVPPRTTGKEVSGLCTIC